MKRGTESFINASFTELSDGGEMCISEVKSCRLLTALDGCFPLIYGRSCVSAWCPAVCLMNCATNVQGKISVRNKSV